ncbi:MULTISPECIES: LLM class flavin-dependent oxidoreductase [Actinoplanes]|uniref:LLM class flavin-dependent oxidoreductase n=1 Tax=Actinoplanes TaxID=1865 RepID=UPI0005F288A4|nr:MULTISPECIES: LLM class flavin-dependent oxidoreductase [Actinoplanes]GLY04317.1 putative FMNH2-utilizing oxygenase [Actinoplanes sp. NBRC 101535]
MTLRLAVELDGGSFAAPDWIARIRALDEAELDFVTFADTFGGAGPEAVLLAARLAPLTRHVGLVPVATTTHTEPFHLSTALATLDFVSRGRAGWQVRVSADPGEAALVGRREPLGFGGLFAEAREAVEVVRRLWDSWQDDAIIKDVATGRYIDRDRLHYVEFDGTYFSVKGPSIVPRPPQGQPVVAALAHGPQVWNSLDVDVYFTTPDAAADIVRDLPAEKKIFIDVAVSDNTVDVIEKLEKTGISGVRLTGADVDGDLVAELRRRGLFTPSDATTLRERLGLPQAVNRYEEAAHA